MENLQDQQQHQYNQPQVALPNATAVLVLGILSLPACCCYSSGLVLGIIALILAGKDIKRYLANPAMFTTGSYSNLKAGRICAIIGVSISILYLFLIIAMIGMFGWAAMQDPNAMREAMEHMMDK